MINDEIRFKEIRLIDSNGDMIGVVPIAEARTRADERELDLVCIAPTAETPVCKIMNYGKYMFELAKKEREAKKNQKVTEVKEVQLKLRTEEHDLGFKTRNACRFLQEGDRVKVVLKFRGREMTYTSQGYVVMREFAEVCKEFGQIDRDPKVEGRNMIMFLQPKK
jgi:translation initiation factor IF-3